MKTTEQRPRGVMTFLTAAFVLLALCLLSPTHAAAQWTQPDASNNTTYTNAGNVGVGTTSPTNKLTVSNGTATGNDAFALFGNVTPGSSQIGMQFGRSGATSGVVIIQGVK